MARASDIGLTAADIRASELYGKLIRADGEGADFPDAEILRKIVAAEDFYKQALKIALKPTRVFSAPQLRLNSPDARVRIDDFDSATDIAEPAYDYESHLFHNNRWGHIRLAHSPIRSVENVFFWYPGTSVGASWQIQPDWRRIDYQFGSLQIVPASGALMPLISVNAYVLSSIGGGRDIPQSIFVDYTVGFSTEELEANYQHLIEGIRLRTLLNLFGVLTTLNSGGLTGGSLSLDGLSNSKSYGGKYGAYSGEIELAIQNEQQCRDMFYDDIHGVMMDFM